MSIIWDKDWRYKIALDDSLTKEVTNFAESLSDKKAKKAMQYEIKFFKKYYSIEQVISRVQSLISDQEFNNFVKIIKKTYQNILFIPKELEKYYRNEILKLNKLYHDLLNFVLDMGLKSKVVPPMHSYYKIILGKFYSKTIAKCNKYASSNKRTLPKVILQEHEVRNALEMLKKKISNNPSILNLWGKENEIDYTLKFNNSFGFGKFRSENTSGLNNVFTVNCPDNKVLENDLQMQYLTNVYPGYAHFVNKQFANTKNRNIDFGASFIFNGWSTFSAWHIFPSLYTKNLKIENSKIVKLMLAKNSTKNYSRLYMLLLNTYEQNIALKLFRQLTQIPAKFESRILGALATEVVIDSGYAINPNNYLDRLSKSDITNYFTSLSKLK